MNNYINMDKIEIHNSLRHHYKTDKMAIDIF